MRHSKRQNLATEQTNTTFIKHYFSKKRPFAHFSVGFALCAAMYMFSSDTRTVNLSLFDYLPIKGINQANNRIDNPSSLFDFSEKLGQLRTNETQKVRIFHFHDATETANLASYLGDRMQASFGASGTGFYIPKIFYTDETTFQSEGKLTPTHWTSRTLDDGTNVGLGANSFISKQQNASIALNNELKNRLQNNSFTSVYVLHHNKLGAVDLSLDVPSLDHNSRPTYTGEMSSVFRLAKSTPKADLKIRTASGSGFNLDGIILEKDSKGVVYNDIPLAHATFKGLSKARYMTRQLGEQFPDLIILSLGFEEAKEKDLDEDKFEKAVKGLINDFQKSCPGAAILICTPNVSKSLVSNFPSLDQVGNSLRSIADNKNIAIWDAQRIVTPVAVSEKQDGLVQGKLLYRALIQNFNEVVHLLP